MNHWGISTCLVATMCLWVSCTGDGHDSGPSEGPGTSQDALSVFMDRPTSESWEALRAAASRRPGHDPSRLVRWFVEADQHRIRRHLPNSMALVGTTPNEKVWTETVQFDLAAAHCPPVDEQLSTAFLKAMAGQSFDESYVLTACEIMGRRDRSQPFYGDWRISAVAGFAPITTRTPEEAAAYIGTPAHYSSHLAWFGIPDHHVRCTSPRYVCQTVGREQFLSDHRTAPESLGLHGPTVTRVEVSCDGGCGEIFPGDHLIIKSPDVLIVSWDGVDFELQRR